MFSTVKRFFFGFLWGMAASALFGCSGNGSSEGNEGTPQPPLDGEDALGSMELMEGFRIEPFVTEPLIQDPVAMEVDESGRIYVVEMRSYPLDASGLGRVKLLEDTNGDGLPDAATVFADSLRFPKGVMRWKDGILVADAPDLYYLEDSTGDGVADIREVMLTGFALSNPQHNFNTPLFGPDNWIYLSNNGAIGTETYADLFGDKGSEVRFPGVEDAPVLPVNAGDRNVRFKPDQHKLELRSAKSQYGHTFDAWGRHFLVSNAHHQYVEAMAFEYVERNPGLPLRDPVHYPSTYGNAAEVYPVTVNPEHQLLTDRGVFTSASGLTWYLGGLFPEEFDKVTFVAESVHNLVHAAVVEEERSQFRTTRLLERREFLASRDSWFRPVQFYIGPDGALYVIDYYRRIIEHPQWMDDEVAADADLYESTTRGRIYRVVPEKAPPADWVSGFDLTDQTAPELVRHLESPNIWWRRTAQRLLLDRDDENSTDSLRNLVLDSGQATARVHALWTLDGLGRLTPELIRHALQDDEPGVRENAIRLAEQYLDEQPDLADALFERAADSSVRVQYQLLLTLGDLTSEEAGQIRDQILFEHIEDEWIQLAYLSAVETDGSRLLPVAVDKLTDTETPGRALFFRRLAASISHGAVQVEIKSLLRESLNELSDTNAWWKSAILSGLVETLPNIRFPVSEFKEESRILVRTFFETDLQQVRNPVIELLELFGLPDEIKDETLQHAVSIATDSEKEGAFRAAAIRLISRFDPERYEQELRELSSPEEPPLIQQEAVTGLGNIPGIPSAEFLLERWETMTPAVRDRAVDALMKSDDRMALLLEAVEEGLVRVSAIGWSRRVVLMRDTGGDIRERARELLREDPAARTEALEKYRHVTELNGNSDKGREVYQAVCSSCHQVSGKEGIAFGPDLATVRHWTPQALVSKILDPNRSVADGYEMWIINRRDGSSVAGVIAEETQNSVILKNAGGVETTVPRHEIESITSSNVTAMPAGLENEIDPQEMADLIAYIRRL